VVGAGRSGSVPWSPWCSVTAEEVSYLCEDNSCTFRIVRPV
jgi:hypothetical protein